MGAAAKLPSSQRAVQLLQRLTEAPVALLDGFDTFVANAPSHGSSSGASSDANSDSTGDGGRDAQLNRPAMERDTVVVGGECNHYPRCRVVLTQLVKSALVIVKSVAGAR